MDKAENRIVNECANYANDHLQFLTDMEIVTCKPGRNDGNNCQTRPIYQYLLAIESWLANITPTQVSVFTSNRQDLSLAGGNV